MPKLTHTTVAIAILVLGLATLAGAWGFQLIGGYVPCKLCLQERIPYYAGLPLIAIALALAASPIDERGSLTRTLLGAGGLVFLVGAGLGIRHAGVEWDWWPGPSDCGDAGRAIATTPAELLQQLENIRIVSCSDAPWRFPAAVWGLSFAGWNAAVSAALALASLVGAMTTGRANA